MPRFSKEERRALIEVLTEATEVHEPRYLSHVRLVTALRKLKASDEHHAKREAEGRKA